MNKYYVSKIFIFLCIGLSYNSYSQTVKNTKAFSFEDQVSIDFSSSYNSSLHENSDEDKSIDMDFEINPSLTLANGMKLSAVLGANKNILGERKFLLNDTTIKLSDEIMKIKTASLFGKIQAYLPTSEKSRKVKQLNSSMATSISISMPVYKTGLKVSYGQNFKYSFYKYEVALDGKSNYEYSLGHSVSLSYQINDQFSVSSSNGYKRGFTHYGFRKDLYKFTQEASMNINKMTSMFIGHTNGGNVLAASGDEMDINLADSRESTVYIGITITI